jgi:hypothetical protein
MPGNFKEKIKEKMHIIFIVVMIVYLSALTVKTGQVYWEEFHKQGTPEQTNIQDS